MTELQKDKNFWKKASIEDLREQIGKNLEFKNRDKQGWTALHYAARYSTPEIVEYILDNQDLGLQKADIVARTNKGETAFDLSSENGKFDNSTHAESVKKRLNVGSA